VKTLYKTISWRFFATFFTFIISFALTGSVDIASQITTLEFVVKMLLYYIHEKVWEKVR